MQNTLSIDIRTTTRAVRRSDKDPRQLLIARRFDALAADGCRARRGREQQQQRYGSLVCGRAAPRQCSRAAAEAAFCPAAQADRDGGGHWGTTPVRPPEALMTGAKCFTTTMPNRVRKKPYSQIAIEPVIKSTDTTRAGEGRWTIETSTGEEFDIAIELGSATTKTVLVTADGRLDGVALSSALLVAVLEVRNPRLPDVVSSLSGGVLDERPTHGGFSAELELPDECGQRPCTYEIAVWLLWPAAIAQWTNDVWSWTNVSASALFVHKDQRGGRRRRDRARCIFASEAGVERGTAHCPLTFSQEGQSFAVRCPVGAGVCRLQNAASMLRGEMDPTRNADIMMKPVKHLLHLTAFSGFSLLQECCSLC